MKDCQETEPKKKTATTATNYEGRRSETEKKSSDTKPNILKTTESPKQANRGVSSEGRPRPSEPKEENLVRNEKTILGSEPKEDYSERNEKTVLTRSEQTQTRGQAQDEACEKLEAGERLESKEEEKTRQEREDDDDRIYDDGERQRRPGIPQKGDAIQAVEDRRKTAKEGDEQETDRGGTDIDEMDMPQTPPKVTVITPTHDGMTKTARHLTTTTRHLMTWEATRIADQGRGSYRQGFSREERPMASTTAALRRDYTAEDRAPDRVPQPAAERAHGGQNKTDGA